MLDFYSKEKFSLKKGTGLSEKRDRVKFCIGDVVKYNFTTSPILTNLRAGRHRFLRCH